MKFSELWLHEWIHPSVDKTTLIAKMTMAGFKVDSLECVASDFSNVIIGNIVHVEKNSCDNCDSYINIVDIGHGRFLNIVSTSKKCRINLRVAVALVGAKLSGHVQVKYDKTLGIWSEGILCSFSSLGVIYNNTSDIIELPQNAPVGEDLRDYLKLNDNIINITVTPNRGDCLNLMGISRDIAAIYRLSANEPRIACVPPEIADILSISVENPDACPSYFSRILRNVDFSIPTPLWMKEKLLRCGVQLINVAIDITNYVLLELGQPIQVFDLDRISGGINVRILKEKETIYLSCSKHKVVLSEGTLIVSDGVSPLEIAGVLIGDSAIIDITKTSNILLEAAFFDPLHVIRSAKQYGIKTYSSYRYERYGVNPELVKLSLERVTYYFINICGGLPGKINHVIHENMLPKQKIIILRRLKLHRLLGCIIHDNEVVDILIRLGCKIQYEKLNSSWEVIVPIWRCDITIEEDLIEEIIRLYGYDKITGNSIFTEFNVINSKSESSMSSLSRAKMLLVDLGYQEIITYSFVDPNIQHLLYPKKKFISLLNPLTLDMSVMRLSLWVGLLKSMIYNQNRQQKNIRLFECGKCFMPTESSRGEICQDLMLSGIMTGLRFSEHWNVVPNMLNFYDIKGDVEALLEISGHSNNITFKPKAHAALHPGQSAAIFLNGEYIGIIGAIHPILEKALNLRTRAFVFELFWDKISKSKILLNIVDIPKYPINRRDISILVTEDITAGDIISECKKIMKEKLIDIKLFDIYCGEGIPRGFKSFSISFYICDSSHTLTETEIGLIITECTSVLQNRFQVSFRKNS